MNAAAILDTTTAPIISNATWYHGGRISGVTGEFGFGVVTSKVERVWHGADGLLAIRTASGSVYRLIMADGIPAPIAGEY